MLALLALLIPADQALAPSPPGCGQVAAARLQVLGPSGSESAVPLNTSVWIQIAGAGTSTVFDLEVRRFSDSATVGFHLETLYDVQVPDPDSGVTIMDLGVRVVLDSELDARARYTVAWSYEGTSGGHAFETGGARDDEAPPTPRLRIVTPQRGGRCAAAVGLRVFPDEVAVDLHSTVIDGQLRGLGRPEIPLLVGRPDAPVTFALIALDLAGNRSAPAAPFRGTTPPLDALTPGRPSEPGGCGVTRGSDATTLAVLALGLALAARRRR